MKVEKTAILICSACRIDGPHELLYLSERLCASRCVNCGKTQVYSSHIYTEYARDLAARTAQIPGRVAGDVFHHSAEVAKWPFKALRKPFGLLREVNQITTFERSRRSSTPGRRIR